MQCEMYWGYPAVKCKGQAVSKRAVKLMSGKKRIIGMCAKCQDKYFGKVRRPTKHFWTSYLRLFAGNANR